MIVVAIAILVATTLLPALIRLMGHRVEAGGVAWSVLRPPGGCGGSHAGAAPRGPTATFWQRWTYAVMHRPVVAVVTVSAILLTMAIPVLSLETGNGAIKQFDKDHARVGTELAAEASGGGADLVKVVATFASGTSSDPANAAALGDFSGAGADPEVETVAPAVASGNAALIDLVTKADSAEAEESLNLVTGCATRSCPPRRSHPRRRSRSAGRPRGCSTLAIRSTGRCGRSSSSSSPSVRRPDADAALDRPAAEGGADEPALDRRRLAGPRRRLPVGLAGWVPRLREARRPRHPDPAAGLRSSSGSRWTTRSSCSPDQGALRPARRQPPGGG